MDIHSLYNTVLNQYNTLDRTLLQKEGEYRALSSQQKRLGQEIQEEQAKVQVYEHAGQVVHKLSELSRQDTLDKMAGIVTQAVQDVKDPNLTFRINYKTERNQPVIDFVIYHSKFQREQDIEKSCGGTLEDLVEFPLRVSLLLKWQPQLARIIVFDEAFTQVSKADRPKFAEFIRQLSEELDLQIILVTHSSDFVDHAHQVFKVVHDGEKSSVQVGT